MNIVNLLLAENAAFKFVEVEFFDYNKKTYHYKTLLDVSVGDQVIVDTPSGEFKCVKVLSVKNVFEIEHYPNAMYKWIVSKLDTTQYEANTAMEKELVMQANVITLRKQKEELMAAAKEQFGSGLNSLQGTITRLTEK